MIHSIVLLVTMIKIVRLAPSCTLFSHNIILLQVVYLHAWYVQTVSGLLSHQMFHLKTCDIIHFLYRTIMYKYFIVWKITRLKNILEYLYFHSPHSSMPYVILFTKISTNRKFTWKSVISVFFVDIIAEKYTILRNQLILLYDSVIHSHCATDYLNSTWQYSSYLLLSMYSYSLLYNPLLSNTHPSDNNTPYTWKYPNFKWWDDVNFKHR